MYKNDVFCHLIPKFCAVNLLALSVIVTSGSSQWRF